MTSGDTLIVPHATEGVDGHLWVVISDPEIDPAAVLMVSLTSYDRDKDQTCEIAAGEHEFVTRRTLVCYSDARVASDSQLELLVSRGLMRRMNPVSQEILHRIRQGAWTTDEIAIEHRQILIDQELL